MEFKKTTQYIEILCKKLKEYDPDIAEIIQFGSSVYAPKYAKDVDLLIITKRKKDYTRYFNIANTVDAPINVDIVVHEVGEKAGEDFLRNVLGACEMLYGEGDYIKKLAQSLSDPKFEEAKSSIRVASNILRLALTTENQLDRDRCAREAFDALFHAARIASMLYLSTEVARWGTVKKMLSPYREEFNEIITKLHIDYFYRGNYPKGELEKEFNLWLNRVKVYVDKLEAEVKTSWQGESEVKLMSSVAL